MKRKHIALLITAILILSLIHWIGIGPYTSGSAVQDLASALTELHGEPYTGRETGTGKEDMVFSIESRTFFLTNYNLRRFLGLDYRYSCKVIYTTHTPTGETHTHTVTYTGFDPMGKENDTARAYLAKSSGE